MDEKSTMYTVVHSTNFWGQKSRARVFWKRSKSNYTAFCTFFQRMFWSFVWNDFIWKTTFFSFGHFQHCFDNEMYCSLSTNAFWSNYI